MDEGRRTRLNDGAVILVAVVVVLVVGVLATVHTQAQLVRTKATAVDSTTRASGGQPFVPAEDGAGLMRSQDMARFRQLPRCVRRGVLLAAAQDEDSLPRARPPCAGRPDRMPGRTIRQGAEHAWNDSPDLAAGGFTYDKD